MTCPDPLSATAPEAGISDATVPVDHHRGDGAALMGDGPVLVVGFGPGVQTQAKFRCVGATLSRLQAVRDNPIITRADCLALPVALPAFFRTAASTPISRHVE